MTKTKKRGRGRPILFKGGSVRVGCLAPIEQANKWREVAEKLDIEFSKFMREALENYADKLSSTS